MNNSTSLSSTAALVMAWAAPLYATGPAREFFRQIELSAGEELLSQCDAICPWYGEVILNRKYFIRDWARRQLEQSDQPWRIVIPAAGMSPLSLDLLGSHASHISQIIEYDLEGMEEKRRLYDLAVPNWSDKIVCLTANVSLTSTASELSRFHGGNSTTIPTLVVIEGVSYYLPAVSLKNLVASFHSPDARNRVIIEYMLPDSDIAENRRPIPEGVFRVIEQKCGIPSIRRYSQTEMCQLMEAAEGSADRHVSMREMELLRTGGNQYFPCDHDGWITITTGCI
ncbi:MAG: hypothetical protein WCK47_01905 [bacterium]|nr:hypothetical protein [Candidatus Sumerlaeota bacterium]